VVTESGEELVVVTKETVSQVGGPSADLAGEITLGLAGSLNLRRTVLHLLTLIRPRLGDWALPVLRHFPTTG
jgi:hypothetical protein